jgi:hypothetical protein
LKESLLFAILACGLGIRLIKISQPFVVAWSWRKADMAMIAENFYRTSFNIFYPQVNWAGNAPGYVGTEFPLVSLIAALLYGIFDVQDWIGRSVSVLFYALSLPFLYLVSPRQKDLTCKRRARCSGHLHSDTAEHLCQSCLYA